MITLMFDPGSFTVGMVVGGLFVGGLLSLMTK